MHGLGGDRRPLDRGRGRPVHRKHALDAGQVERPFDDHDRSRYVESLGAAIVPGGLYYMLCFSDRQPGDQGPRRVRQDDIRSSFASGWRVESIEAATMEIATGSDGILAWLSIIARV